MEFFDHYLKGAPAPAWLDRGRAVPEEGREAAGTGETVGRDCRPAAFPGSLIALRMARAERPHWPFAW